MCMQAPERNRACAVAQCPGEGTRLRRLTGASEIDLDHPWRTPPPGVQRGGMDAVQFAELGSGLLAVAELSTIRVICFLLCLSSAMRYFRLVRAWLQDGLLARLRSIHFFRNWWNKWQ